MDKQTQCARLLKALTRKRGVTSLEAATELCIVSLHRRLSDLREMGVEILSHSAKTADGRRFLRYFATKVPSHLTKGAA